MNHYIRRVERTQPHWVKDQVTGDSPADNTSPEGLSPLWGIPLFGDWVQKVSIQLIALSSPIPSPTPAPNQKHALG